MSAFHRVPAIAGSSDAPTREQVIEALGGVLDPELGMSVVELGLVYGIEIVNGAVSITMTLTAPGCPVHDVMPDWIRHAVMAVPGVGDRGCPHHLRSSLDARANHRSALVAGTSLDGRPLTRRIAKATAMMLPQRAGA